MDFKEMKDRILIVDVLYRYNVRLRKKPDSDYASCACPLPTHPQDDRNNNCFGVHLPTNRYQCKHPNCAKINGVGNKWGDCINLVMTMGKMDFRSAGKQLESWFPNKKPALQNGTPEAGRSPHPNRSDHTVSAVAVKYTEKVREWFDTIWPKKEGENDSDYRKRLLHDITSQLIQNYRAGKAGRVL
jgi:hypothetical protein